MSPLPYPIEAPKARYAGRVGIRAVHRRDGAVLRRLLTENREWLQPWEATFPGGGEVSPGSQPLGPTIRAFQRQRRLGNGVSFVMLFDREVVGQLSLSEISAGALRSTSIGYWVSKHVAGQGVTPTAVALATDYAFTELRLHRVEICIRPENTASLRVVQKLGFRYEGLRARYIHIDGKWCDHESYALTEEEVPGGMLERIGAPTV